MTSPGRQSRFVPQWNTFARSMRLQGLSGRRDQSLDRGQHLPWRSIAMQAVRAHLGGLITQGPAGDRHPRRQGRPTSTGRPALQAFFDRGSLLATRQGLKSLLRPDTSAATKALPGASPSRRLVVNGAQSTEPILLRLRLSAWTIRTGRRNPGSVPNGTPRSAHQMSPRVISRKLAKTFQSRIQGTRCGCRAMVAIHFVQTLSHVRLLAIAQELLKRHREKPAAGNAKFSRHQSQDPPRTLPEGSLPLPYFRSRASREAKLALTRADETREVLVKVIVEVPACHARNSPGHLAAW